MKIWKWTAALMAVAMVWMAPTGEVQAEDEAAEGVPHSLTHQGRLLDDDGAPVTGDVELSYTIYDAADSGDVLWQDVLEISVDDTGFYTVVLGGEENPIDPVILSDGVGWLGVAVDQEAEMTPRISLTSVPFALRAQRAQSAAVADYAGVAEFADEAATADSADHADSADTAGHADSADTAGHADSADHATTADSASTAGYADSADHASSADSATTADSADHADTAGHADSADTADFADVADHANTCTDAEFAEEADFADEAATADLAMSLDQSASIDIDGHISTTGDLDVAGDATVEGEVVAKVLNGVVYAGHPDFDGDLQAAIDFADDNGFGRVEVPPGTYQPISVPTHMAVVAINNSTYPQGRTVIAGHQSSEILPGALSTVDLNSRATIKGFVINAAGVDSGVIAGSHTRITNNRFREAYACVLTDGFRNVITENDFSATCEFNVNLRSNSFFNVVSANAATIDENFDIGTNNVFVGNSGN